MATVEERPMVLRTPTSEREIREFANEEGRSWLLLGMTEEMNRRFEELTSRTGDSKADVINKALGLFSSALDALDDGKRVGVVAPGQELEAELIRY